MGRHDKELRILVIDPDEVFQAELRSFDGVGPQLSFLAEGNVGAARDQLAQADIIVVGIDCPAGLSLVADLCARPSMPPVIAVGGASFERKSVEHILLLAEVRGAALALPKPLSASELLVAAIALARGIPAAKAPGDAHAPCETRDSAGA